MKLTTQSTLTKSQACQIAETIRHSTLYNSDATTTEIQYYRANLLYPHTTSQTPAKIVGLCCAPALIETIRVWELWSLSSMRKVLGMKHAYMVYDLVRKEERWQRIRFGIRMIIYRRGFGCRILYIGWGEETLEERCLDRVRGVHTWKFLKAWRGWSC